MNLVSSIVSTRFIFKERPGEKEVMSKCNILNFFNMELYLSLIFSALLALISSSGVPLNFLNFRKFKFAFTQICYFTFALYKRWSRQRNMKFSRRGKQKARQYKVCISYIKNGYFWQDFKPYLGSNMGNSLFILQCFKGLKNLRFEMNPAEPLISCRNFLCNVVLSSLCLTTFSDKEITT